MLENHNDDLSIPFEFNKIAHFKINPIKDKLPSAGGKRITVTFTPNNLGVFSSTIMLELIGGVYKIPIKLHGVARKIGAKPKAMRGPEATKKDFEEQPKFFQEEKALRQIERIKTGEPSIPRWLKETTTQQVDEQLNGRYINQMNATATKFKNTYLQEERVRREQQELKKMKMKNSKKFPKSLDEYLNDKDLNLEEGRPPSPKLFLTATNEPLWVVKAVGQHEPSATELRTIQKFESTRPARKDPFDTIPKGEEQNNHCNKELTGGALQKISAGPTIIDFGNLFVNSEEIRYFNVSNDLHEFILVRFQSIPDLHIIPEQQVIPGGAIASFTLKFKAKNPRECNSPLIYTINKNNEQFRILVKARVEPVKLQIEPMHLEFPFNYDVLERSMTNELRIANPGNGVANFSIDFVSSSPQFKLNTSQLQMQGSPVPGQGQMYSINARETKLIKVTYTPNAEATLEEAKIAINVTYGDKLFVTCRGTCPQGECELEDGGEIDFGEVQVGETKMEEKYIKIRNKRTKEIAIVHMDQSGIPELKLSKDSTLRLQGSQGDDIPISISCDVIRKIQGELKLYVRGGKTLTAKISANIIAPEVSIIEQILDYGLLTAQSTKTLPLTFENKSKIEAILVMNFENERELSLVRLNENEKEGRLEFITEEKKEEEQGDIDENVSESEESVPNKELEECRKYRIGVPPLKTFKLGLRFTPEVTTRDLKKIILPIELKGVGRTAELKREVHVDIKPSKVNIEPILLEFEDKVVTGKSYPATKEIIVFL